MSNKRDYYDILGVSKNASDDELKKQYRLLSKKFHPDLQAQKTESEKKDAEEKFKEINEAYSVLSDKDKRAQYDRFGFDGPASNGFGGEGFDPFSFFRSHFGGGGGFSDFFGGSSGFRSSDSFSNPNKDVDVDAPENGEDVLVNMSIDFRDVVYGATKDITISSTEECSECGGRGVAKNSKVEICPECNGRGHVVRTTKHGFMISQTIAPCSRCEGTGKIMTKCSKCHGEKRTYVDKHISIKIPSGIQSGQRLRIKGCGQCGVKGGSNGDMYVNVVVKNSDVFRRVGSLDLESELFLNPIVATLGGNVEVQTPFSAQTVKIPSGTTTGKKIRVNGHGIASSTGKGDLILNVIVEPLINLSDSQRSMLESINASLNATHVAHAVQHNLDVNTFRGNS